MIESIQLLTAAENATEAAGSSLAKTLYRKPVTIGLSGALGTGKTACMRGFLRELGVETAVTSPTYALEQRYETARGPVLHLDLYRLNQIEALQAVRSSDDHEGIRCIEWPEIAGNDVPCDIAVRLTETARDHRQIDIEFRDSAWPDDAIIDAWRQELHLPPWIIAHCDAIAEYCDRASDALHAQGIAVRKRLVHAAAKTHDLLRFWDFRPGAAPAGTTYDPEAEAVWNDWKTRFDAASHEEAAVAFLNERGFPHVAHIVGAHGLRFPMSERTTTEQRLLYYADKRFMNDTPVSVVERFLDFTTRYGHGIQTPENAQWEQDTLETERLLFPDGVPF